MGQTAAARAGVILVLSAGLAACGGGGGVGSTPAPPPAPTPTPPASFPSSANADLITLNQSENFTNDAAVGTASYPTFSGNGTSSTSAGPVQVSYDAATRTYTLTSGARSQAFAPGNIDTAQSSGAATVYTKTSGTTTDTLTLTKPGTTGPLTYKYVGAAVWQRTVTGATTVSGSFDAAAYGVETPDAAVPRVGGAQYDVVLLGTVARPDTLYALSGQGALTVNFLNGAVSGSSFANGVRETNAQNGFPGRSGEWRFTGALAAATNAITGTMDLYYNTTDPMSGPAAGRLYGPAADEVGLAFRGAAGDGASVVGLMLGRKAAGTISGQNPSLLSLQFTQVFPGPTRVYGYGASDYAGTSKDFAGQNLPQNWNLEFRYNAADQAFDFSDYIAGVKTVVFSTKSTASAALSDGRFAGYANTSTADRWNVRIYKNGSANSDIQLTYASFVVVERTTELAPGFLSFTSAYLPFGISTPNANMPTTGTASYAAKFYGSANDGMIGSPLASATGDLNLSVNFGTSVLTGTFNPIIRYANGTTYDLGTMTLVNTIYSNPVGTPSGAGFYGEFSNAVVYGGVLGGGFLGPAYSEIAGNAYAKYVPAGTSGISGVLWGAFVGKKN